ncbi:PREDICTED: putative F-box/FBD/LRR-repeat protein At2g05300 [Camelina sativa]|uniref:F-box/FBD/LRR-repeat protein At2g05300 n=1 Tax=Camelina sativa TaxID=90675 RepID=A0ABM1QLK6_CAMSA|nr:PREDICTED: putative F-box/FBD/LRR-repeat protein At2g05300 [Camelina sativa]
MVGRGEAKQARSKGLSSERLKEDRISQLPDPLICQNLSHLPPKESVKTSVLSTRWTSLWLFVPSLELAWWHLPNSYAFKSFGYRFFDSDRASCINKLKLTIDENDASYLTSWIQALVKRKIQCLYIRRSRGDSFHEMPSSIYISETLVSLKLYQLTLVNAEFVSLPCLKIFYLKDIVYPNEATFERLVSSSPVLEDLKVDVLWTDGKVYRVHSRSLKRLRLHRSFSFPFDSSPGVVVDAPLLCCLRIEDRDSESVIVNNVQSNAKLDISLHFGLGDFDEASVSSRISSIRKFTSGILTVMDMTICVYTFKIIHHYSKVEPLPQFNYMSHLHVKLDVSDLKGLQTFIERCPNLKSLILDLDDILGYLQYEEINQISFPAGISWVMVDMTISTKAFKLIYHSSKLEPLPQFGYMSRLYIVSLCVSIVKWLPTFLESCPNLKSLILSLDDFDHQMHSEERNQISFLSVPGCLLSSLEFVEFSCTFSGDAAEMKLVHLMLTVGNSASNAALRDEMI